MGMFEFETGSSELSEVKILKIVEHKNSDDHGRHAVTPCVGMDTYTAFL